MKNVIYILLLVSFSIHVVAQKSKADKHYDSKGYGVYLELKSNEDLAKIDLNTLIRMARSSRKTGDSQTAEKLYAILIEKDEKEPMYHLHYAKALQTNGRYLKARNHYRICDKMLEEKANGKPFDQRAKLGWQACNQMAELRAIGEVNIINDPVLNSSNIDFSPIYYKDGIVFVSTRTKGDKKDRWLNDNYMDLYYSTQVGESYSKPEIFADELNTEYHEGPSVFSKDEKTIYFTRNNFHKGKRVKSQDGTTKLKIFSAQVESGEWTDIKDLSFNSHEYDVAHPALTKAENIIVFASNKKGGFGGMDLYAVYLEGENWSKPVNLGSRVNTAGDEVFPYIHLDGTLFFASNGWSTLGGLDIFMAGQVYNHPDSLWEFPFNVGAPLNSQADDFGLIINKNKTSGFFSSNREGGSGEDDIYRFKIKDGLDGVAPIPSLTVDVCVYNDDTRLRLDNAKVIVKRDTELKEDAVTSITNENGYTTCKLRAGDPYFVEVIREGYFNVSDYFIMPKDVTGVDEYCVGMTRDHAVEIVEEVVVESRRKYITTDIPPVNYEYDISVPLGPTYVVGKVMNTDYKKPLPNASVILLNRCNGEELVMEVSENGEFGFPLECGCEYVVKSKKNKFFGDNQVISLIDEVDCNKAIEVEMDMSPDFNEKGDPFMLRNQSLETTIDKGDVIELKSIYYDYDKWNIRPDAANDLKDLVIIMKRNPSMEIELSSHTDSRGSASYNQELSRKRASTVKEYLLFRGIKSNRIVATGYGEDRLKNTCKICSEANHQENRRTEVLITRMDKSN
ncbi:MAG: OmpA family protein [Saprospiraceae bacterium]|nr:OmpA family protein [Saprospiraceae bacterium]